VATDYRELTENLGRFYDFAGKVVLYVGAGGRQLLSPSIAAKKLIAIDQDVESLREINANVAAKSKEPMMEVIGTGFEDVTVCGDVVYFEFCLHEMNNPEEALAHAHSLAPDIVVFDHSVGSMWAFHAAEEEKVRRSAEAMNRFGIRRREKFHTVQHFQDYSELLAKVAPQGSVAIERVKQFTGATNIVIPMSYELAVL
jgi:hypothetical protein